MTTFQPLDVIRVSATPDKAVAEPNRDVEIVKLIDVSNCTGCKACQAACLDWNEKRPAIGENVGLFENPLDLGSGHVHDRALRRMGQSQDRQFRMAHPQIRLHALRGPGLPQGLPGPRRHRAVREWHRELHPGKLHRLRLLREGLPLQRAARLEDRAGRVQVHALLRQGGRWPAALLREGLPDQRHRVRPQGGGARACGRAGSPISSRAASSMPDFTTRKGWAARTSCTCSITRTSRSFIRGFRQIR